MAGALILITAKVGMMKEVLENVKELALVKDARMLTGPYDIMAIARADSMSEITDVLVEKVRKMDGVEGTVTNVFITQYLT